jgi:hypothetical protein
MRFAINRAAAAAAALSLSTGLAWGGTARAAALTATADAFVQRGAATGASGDPSSTNFGTDTQINVKIATSATSATTRKGFVRFDLSPVSPATGASTDFTAAALRLGVTTFSGGTATSATFNVFGLNDGQASEAFTEGTGQTSVTGATPPNPIVYANAPGMDDSSDGVNNTLFANGGAPLATFTVTTSDVGGYVSVSSQALADFLNADTNNVATLVLTRRSTGDTNADNLLNSLFASRQHATLSGPTLLTNESVPEPGGLGLAAFVATTATLRRRRRR